MTERLEVLISADRIAKRVAELGRALTELYPTGDVLVVCVLKGSFMFLADLVRHLSPAIRIDFLRTASYGAATETSGVVQFRMDVDTSVTDRDVLVVEDILDTGLTLDYLMRHLQSGGPRSLKTCVLLDKRARRKVELTADFVGFEIADQFVVGYGLDFDERFRNLPDVCILHQSP